MTGVMLFVAGTTDIDITESILGVFVFFLMASLLKFRWEGSGMSNGPADEELNMGVERTTETYHLLWEPETTIELMMMPFGCGTHNQNHPLSCKTPLSSCPVHCILTF